MPSGKILAVHKELHMKRFNWITTLLLNVVTLGIYSIYVWYTLGKQHNDRENTASNERQEENSNVVHNLLLANLLSQLVVLLT